ncbi:MAG: MGMT family protein [Dehalococcoidales bacterium]|nr:MGMT family protein [Dehalococcoidales bacterium]
MAKRKTWREKLEAKQERKIVDNPRKEGTLLIPRPLDVDALMRRVPKGKLITITQIRGRLAGEHGADDTCPLCAGIFLRIAAEVAEEDLGMGVADITPYWRVLKGDGRLNEKFPCGVEAQAARLEEEGHTIEPGRGKKPPKVKDFEGSLVEL